ncbi:hypothetical protein [Bacillus pseudomycoides]|uniref:hypothetical protein n=1 Tax=Bacillus pseudomycoides TaxID=64104 RepID=UPI0023DC780E|nr:hypothetical protein [Bacillus pseudomycoides]MDF2083816.1 hypothetical protein [Bacillus pseudomycoides]
MANLLTKLFGGSKEKAQVKQGELQGKISTLDSKIAQVNNALAIAEANLLVDESASNKKAVEKLQAGIEKFQAEKAKANEELSEVVNTLQEVAHEERKARLLELAHEDAGNTKQPLKEMKLARYLGGLQSTLNDYRSDYSVLERELGIKYTGRTDTDVTWGDFPEELAMKLEVEEEMKTEVDKEFAELVKAIDKYLGR